MSEHGSRRAGGGGSRGGGRRSASAGGFGDKLEGIAGQLSGVFGKRGGGRRGGGADDDGYGYGSHGSDGYDDGYGSQGSQGYGSYDDRFGDEPAEVGTGGPGGSGGSGGGRRGRSTARRGASRSGGEGDLPPKDWWMKFIDYPRYGKRGWRHWMPSIKQMLSFFLAFLFSVIGLVAYAYANTKIPTSHNNIADGDPTVFTFDDGQAQIAKIGVNYYEVKDINQIPKVVQNAFVAAENYSFWTDPGVSFSGVARSALNDLFGSGGKQGGSTITQQYVKNAFLSQDQTLARKVNEVLISIKLSHQWSKQQILLGYLNQISFGRGAYGIDAASRAYLGKPISKLTENDVGDAAFLAALVNDPSNFSRALANGKARTDNPKTFDRFVRRYNAILKNMSDYKFVPKPTTDQFQGKLPQVQDQVPDNDLTGYKGYLKDAAEAYLAAQVAAHPEDGQTQTYANIDTLSKGGYKIVTTYNKTMMDDSVQAANALWTGTSGGGGGKLNPKHPSDHDVHLAFASIDPHNGYLKSFYTGTDGAEDYSKDSFNYALQGGVQVGSTFKPITLATALQSGKFSLDSTEPGDNSKPLFAHPGDPKPITFINQTTHKEENWPPNEDEEVGGTGGMATLRQGMAMSLNSVFAALELDPSIGTDAVYGMAEALGIKDGTPDLLKVPSLTLGTAEITPMRMASVYSAFANGGVAHDPVQVTKIINMRTNQVVWQPVSDRHGSTWNKQVITNNTAAGVTSALQEVLKTGTASKNRDAAKLMDAAGGNLAGKTGTTDNNHSAWFTGYSTGLATAVTIFRQTPNKTLESIKGLGYDDQSTRINGMDWPTTVWSKFMSIELGKNKEMFNGSFPAYAPVCSGVNQIVGPGQSVAPGSAAAGNSLPGTPTGSEPNCQGVYVPTPSPTPTPTPTATSSTQVQLPPQCPLGQQVDPGTNQCVPSPVTSSDSSSLPGTPTGTGTSNTSSPSQPSGNPSTSSTRYCKTHPTDPGCAWYTSSTSSSSSSSSTSPTPTGGLLAPPGG